jgi:hypothetical protein
MWLGATLSLLLCTEARAQWTVWEVEFHSGAMIADMAATGTFALPAHGASSTPGGSRPVSSWYFGDGSFQLNQFISVRNAGQLIPLDGALQRQLVERPSGGTFGVRVARRVTGRWSAELTVDYGVSQLALTDETSSSLEAARASFITAFNGLMSGGLFGSRVVDSTLVMTEHSGRQIITTGAVLFDVMPSAKLAPYVTVGAGAVATVDSAPRAVLTGTYQFALNVTGFPGPTPTFRQIDTLTVRSTIESGPVWIVGGGVKYPVSRHWQLRFDVRDYMRGSTVSTQIEASPATPPSQFGVLTTSTLAGPPVVFSNASFFPGSEPTLSVPLREFTTFTGTGVEHQISLTAGVSWRF